MTYKANIFPFNYNNDYYYFIHFDHKASSKNKFSIIINRNLQPKCRLKQSVGVYFVIMTSWLYMIPNITLLLPKKENKCQHDEIVIWELFIILPLYYLNVSANENSPIQRTKSSAYQQDKHCNNSNINTDEVILSTDDNWIVVFVCNRGLQE